MTETPRTDVVDFDPSGINRLVDDPVDFGEVTDDEDDWSDLMMWWFSDYDHLI